MSKILIIEDDSDLREGLAFALELEGYETAQARSCATPKRCSRRRRGICCCSIAICRMAADLTSWQSCMACVQRRCSC